MLDVNKSILPLLVWSFVCYVVSQWLPVVWVLVPLVLPVYLYASSEHFADILYGRGKICRLAGVNAVSGMIPRKFVKVSPKLWNGPFREMMLAHEEGHLKGAHSILGLMGITLYAIIFMMTVRVGAPFFGALLLVPIIFLLQYGMFTIFEMRADQYASTRGYKGELIEFLSDIAPKSVCNALRLWVLK